MQSAYFYASFDKNTSEIKLDSKESHHALNVRRIKNNEEVFVTNGRGLVASTFAVDLKPDVVLKVTTVSQSNPAKPKVTVLQAVIKSDRADLAVELMSEVGVDEIIFWPAERSVAKLNEKIEKTILKWKQTALAALKQSRGSLLTEIKYVTNFQEILKFIEEKQSVFLLDFEASEKIGDQIPGEAVIFLVGPEGGLTDKEKSSLLAAGVKSINIGSTVLRGSTAGAIACALIRNIK
jgi:16S rRNA (uracil1498-N3)-methyltransferase